MKKIGMILLIILAMCFIPKVYAAEGVAIESVDLDSKSTNAVIVSDATFEGLSLKFDIKFDDIDDFVKYKLVIKNSSDSSYELTESTSSSSYITYEYSYEDGSKVLSGNTSKTMFITIKYTNAVPVASFTNGNYTETKSFTINLEDGTDEVVDVVVPSTLDGLYCYLVLLVGTLVFSLALLKATKNKKFLVLIIASMVLIPLNIHAISKLKITVESKVEINNPNEITPMIYWAIQENGEANGYDIVTGDPAVVPVYKLVISNKELSGVHSGSFAGTKEFTYDDVTNTYDVPWLTYDYLINYVSEVQIEGRVVPASTACWFLDLGCELLDEVKIDLTNLNTSNVTDMTGMFSDFGNNSKTVNINLSGLNTSNVTNMIGMFSYVGADAETVNINLSGLDTSNVTNMSYMFGGAGINAETVNINLSGLNTSNVTSMFQMFYKAGKESTTFNLNLSGLNTSNVTDIDDIFYETGANATTYNLNLSNWSGLDDSIITDILAVLESSASILNIDLSGWNTSNITDMSNMFYNFGKNATTFSLDLSGWDTSNVTDMSGTFSHVGWKATTFDLDLSGWDTSNVTNMASMFYDVGEYATTFSLDLSGWNTSNVTNMSNMFNNVGCHSSSFMLDISGFNTSNVNFIVNMFDHTGIDAVERNIILPETNGNGINNTATRIYGMDNSIFCDINNASVYD